MTPVTRQARLAEIVSTWENIFIREQQRRHPEKTPQAIAQNFEVQDADSENGNTLVERDFVLVEWCPHHSIFRLRGFDELADIESRYVGYQNLQQVAFEFLPLMAYRLEDGQEYDFIVKDFEAQEVIDNAEAIDGFRELVGLSP